jgi:hypothetical protein
MLSTFVETCKRFATAKNLFVMLQEERRGDSSCQII